MPRHATARKHPAAHSPAHKHAPKATAHKATVHHLAEVAKDTAMHAQDTAHSLAQETVHAAEHAASNMADRAHSAVSESIDRTRSFLPLYTGIVENIIDMQRTALARMMDSWLKLYQGRWFPPSPMND